MIEAKGLEVAEALAALRAVTPSPQPTLSPSAGEREKACPRCLQKAGPDDRV